MKKTKKLITWGLILSLLIPFYTGTSVSRAATNESANYETKLLQAEEMVRNGGGDYTLAIVTDAGLEVIGNDISRVSGNKGYITGDGVRLRKAPKSTATVLELMSKNEVVVIDYAATNVGCTTGKWFYVKRVKTGTWGWVNTNYLATP